MSPLGLSPSGRLAGLAPLVLRVVLGVVMIAHGYLKLAGGPARFGQQTLAALGVPAPVLVGYVVTITEVAGGILLMVGLLSRVAAIGLAIEMVFTIVLVKADVGLIAASRAGAGAELDLVLMAGFLAIAVAGPGRLSLDRAVGLEKPRAVGHPRPDLAAIGRSADRLRETGRAPAPAPEVEPGDSDEQRRPAAEEVPRAADTTDIGGPGPPVPQVEEAETAPAAGREAEPAVGPVSRDAGVDAPIPPRASLGSTPAAPSGAPRPEMAAGSTVQRLRERPGLTIAAGVAAGLLIRSALRRR